MITKFGYINSKDIRNREQLVCELIEANIDIYEEDECCSDYNIYGKVNNFVFERRISYWVVKGYMPIKYANYIFENYNDLSIRVEGSNKSDKPEDWCTTKELDEIMKNNKDISKILSLYDNYWNDYNGKDEKYISIYHIDTIEGLKLFVKVIKENNIKGKLL